MKKLKDLTIGEIRKHCIRSNECWQCPLHKYNNVRLCDVALRTRELNVEELEVEK